MHFRKKWMSGFLGLGLIAGLSMMSAAADGPDLKDAEMDVAETFAYRGEVSNFEAMPDNNWCVSFLSAFGGPPVGIIRGYEFVFTSHHTGEHLPMRACAEFTDDGVSSWEYVPI